MNIHHPSTQTQRENSAAVRLISHASLTVINGGKDMSLSIYNMQAAMHCRVVFICWQVAGRPHTDSYANDRNIKLSAYPSYTLPPKNTLSARVVWCKSVLILARKVKCNFGKTPGGFTGLADVWCMCLVNFSMWSHTCNSILIHEDVWQYIKFRVCLRFRSHFCISHEIRFKQTHGQFLFLVLIPKCG